MAHTMIQEWHIGHLCWWNQMLIDGKVWRTRRLSSTTLEDSKHIHTDSPNHTIMLENTKILSMEHKLFERGVMEAIYIRALKPSLNRDCGWHNLPPVWNNIIKERLTENGAGTTTGGWGGSSLRNFVSVPVRLQRLEIPSYWQRLQLQLKALVNVKSFILCYTVTTCE